MTRCADEAAKDRLRKGLAALASYFGVKPGELNAEFCREVFEDVKGEPPEAFDRGVRAIKRARQPFRSKFPSAGDIVDAIKVEGEYLRDEGRRRRPVNRKPAAEPRDHELTTVVAKWWLSQELPSVLGCLVWQANVRTPNDLMNVYDDAFEETDAQVFRESRDRDREAMTALRYDFDKPLAWNKRQFGPFDREGEGREAC